MDVTPPSRYPGGPATGPAGYYAQPPPPSHSGYQPPYASHSTAAPSGTANAAGGASNSIIVVSSLDGKKYKLVMNGDLNQLTISKVKRYLQSATGLDIGQQVLRFNGQVVSEGANGGDLGLFDGAVMFLETSSAVPAARSGSGGLTASSAAPGGSVPFDMERSMELERARDEERRRVLNNERLDQERRAQDAAMREREREQERQAAEEVERLRAERARQRQEQEDAHRRRREEDELNRRAEDERRRQDIDAQLRLDRQAMVEIQVRQQQHEIEELKRAMAALAGSGGGGGQQPQATTATATRDEGRRGASGGEVAPMPGGPLSSSIPRQQHQQQPHHAHQHHHPQQHQQLPAAPPASHRYDQADAGYRGGGGGSQLHHTSLTMMNHSTNAASPTGASPADRLSANLRALACFFGVPLLELDANNTCVINLAATIDAEEDPNVHRPPERSLLLTFDPVSERLYLYSTIGNSLPQDPMHRLRLYEALLEGAVLGRDMAGGGVGVSLKSSLVLLSTSLDLRHCDDEAAMAIADTFIESVDRWTAVVRTILGSPPPPHPSQSSQYGGTPQAQQGGARPVAMSPVLGSPAASTAAAAPATRGSYYAASAPQQVQGPPPPSHYARAPANPPPLPPQQPAPTAYLHGGTQPQQWQTAASTAPNQHGTYASHPSYSQQGSSIHTAPGGHPPASQQSSSRYYATSSTTGEGGMLSYHPPPPAAASTVHGGGGSAHRGYAEW